MTRGDDHRARHLDRIAEVRAGTTPEKVPYPIRIRRTEVVGTRMLGSGLLRLTLGGPGTTGFEAHAPDEHVKLVFPDPSGALRLPEPNGLMLRWPRPSPTSREYTVRRYDAGTGAIDIDVALHPGGLVSDWARAVEPGVPLHVAGPPGGVIVPHVYDRYLLAGDITALPAIARWLEELPRMAEGWAFVEVADSSEEIELSAPPGVDVRWLHRGDVPPGRSEVLERAVTEVAPSGDAHTFVWLAGEAGTLKPLRRWIRDDLGVGREHTSVTGYWKRGVADFDDDHKEHEHAH